MSNFHVNQQTARVLAALGFTAPTPVQEAVLPLAGRGKSLAVTSATGSGKTHAFLIPLFEQLDLTSRALQALIVVPTRELGEQVLAMARAFQVGYPEADIRLYAGGRDKTGELAQLAKGAPHVAIATLGRLLDLAVTEMALPVHTARLVVFDEADMLFTDREAEPVARLFTLLAAEQYLVFSATLSQELQVFFRKYLPDLAVVELKEAGLTKPAIRHIFLPVKARDKNRLLLELLATFQPYLVIIFANTRKTVDQVALFLAEAGYPVTKLTGAVDARRRRQITNELRKGAIQYLVASDIAARGLDITGVSHVVNYDLPSDQTFFVHRSGRTARFDQGGTVYSFYEFTDGDYVARLEAQGLACEYAELAGGVLKPVKPFRAREKRQKAITGAEIALRRQIPLPKKVKPGYKKRREAEIRRALAKQKRQYLNEKYRRIRRKDD